MITTLLTTVLASGLLLSTSFLPVQETKPQLAFTQVLAMNDFVAYTIQPGDTLESIAQMRYDDSTYWTNIWNDNQWIEDPNDLPDGLLLQLRDKKPAEADKSIAKLTSDEVVIPVEEKSEAKTVVAKPTEVEPTVAPTAIVTTAPVVNTSPVAMEEVYKQAGEKYGVPWQILYGLHITETGGRDGMIMNGSGSGARGPMQFMPGTWRAYGADGNGDGVNDIDNAVDAIHGAANYLAKHGTLEQGLRSYGGNYSRTMTLAQEKGYTK